MNYDRQMMTDSNYCTEHRIPSWRPWSLSATRKQVFRHATYLISLGFQTILHFINQAHLYESLKFFPFIFR